jgi:hypothetical protein
VFSSYLYARDVRRGEVSLPRWTALANPAFVMVVLSMLSMPFTCGRQFVVLAAPNLSHVVFFGLLVLATRVPGFGS